MGRYPIHDAGLGQDGLELGSLFKVCGMCEMRAGDLGPRAGEAAGYNRC